MSPRIFRSCDIMKPSEEIYDHWLRPLQKMRRDEPIYLVRHRAKPNQKSKTLGRGLPNITLQPEWDQSKQWKRPSLMSQATSAKIRPAHFSYFASKHVLRTAAGRQRHPAVAEPYASTTDTNADKLN